MDPEHHITSSLCHVLIVALLVTTGGERLTASDAIDPMRAGPGNSVNELRRLQYAGEAEVTNDFIAPAAPGFVDGKARKANRENVQRIEQGVYGFEVVASKADGDAGVALLLVAWTDGDEPKVEFWPFYLWRHDGIWKWLPNPTAVETWYQSVPDELEPGYERLAQWFETAKETHAKRLETDAATLIEGWKGDPPADPTTTADETLEEDE